MIVIFHFTFIDLCILNFIKSCLLRGINNKILFEQGKILIILLSNGITVQCQMRILLFSRVCYYDVTIKNWGLGDLLYIYS